MGWGNLDLCPITIISRIFLLLCVAILIKHEISTRKHIGDKQGVRLRLVTYSVLIGVLLIISGDIFQLSSICGLGIIISTIGILAYVYYLTSMANDLNYLAHRDELTGLANRRYMYNKFNTDLMGAENTSIIFLDINDFKRINDKIGHIKADEILCAVTEEIQASLRNTDVLSRFGGDEFVIMLPDTSEKTALSILARLQENVYKLDFPGGIKVEFSAGVATSPENGDNLDELINLADQELYKAKKNKDK